MKLKLDLKNLVTIENLVLPSLDFSSIDLSFGFYCCSVNRLAGGVSFPWLLTRNIFWQKPKLRNFIATLRISSVFLYEVRTLNWNMNHKLKRLWKRFIYTRYCIKISQKCNCITHVRDIKSEADDSHYQIGVLQVHNIKPVCDPISIFQQLCS